MGLRDEVMGTPGAVAFGPLQGRPEDSPGEGSAPAPGLRQREARQRSSFLHHWQSNNLVEINLKHKLFRVLPILLLHQHPETKGKRKLLFSRVRDDLPSVTARDGARLPGGLRNPCRAAAGSPVTARLTAKKCTSAAKCMINNLNHSSVTALSHDLNGQGRRVGCRAGNPDHLFTSRSQEAGGRGAALCVGRSVDFK